VELGRLVGTHGVRGELKLKPHNLGSEALVPGLVVRVSGRAGELEVLGARPHKRMVLVTLQGVASVEAALSLVGSTVSVATADLPVLGAGEFYWFEVIGLEAVTEDGRRIGRVTDILESPGHDLYAVAAEGREVLVPAVDDVVIAIEPEAGRIVIRPPDGLLEL
jgi:16S rRNA processing protein RimM